jgi:hypothetical protein
MIRKDGNKNVNLYYIRLPCNYLPQDNANTITYKNRYFVMSNASLKSNLPLNLAKYGM